MQQSLFSNLISSLRKIGKVGLRQFSDEFQEHEKFFQQIDSLTKCYFLSVLYHDVGLNVIKEKIAIPFKDLNIATHYGCHAQKIKYNYQPWHL